MSARLRRRVLLEVATLDDPCGGSWWSFDAGATVYVRVAERGDDAPVGAYVLSVDC